MNYGYARVSTRGQADDGNSLEAQEKALLEAGAMKIYKDVFTGTTEDRSELNKLMSVVRCGDTVTICKLDRISRSVKGGIDILDRLFSMGVRVNILNMAMIDINTTTGKLMRTIFLAFAEYERDMIVQRTTEGKGIARMNSDYHEGRPKKKVDITKELELVRSKKITIAEACQRLNISKPTWYSRVNELEAS